MSFLKDYCREVNKRFAWDKAGTLLFLGMFCVQTYRSHSLGAFFTGVFMGIILQAQGIIVLKLKLKDKFK